MPTSKHGDIRLIDCTQEAHAAAILEILNEAIINSTALYDYAPRSIDSMKTWFATKRNAGFPIVGIVDADGNLLGFGTWGTFRAFPAYKYSVEHSIYVHHDHRGRCLGKLLLQELVSRAEQANLHIMIGCIDAANEASIRLHTQLGFVPAGTLNEVGFKFGKWLNAAFYQLTLKTPLNPIDG